jgi:hypothetical protein
MISYKVYDWDVFGILIAKCKKSLIFHGFLIVNYRG